MSAAFPTRPAVPTGMGVWRRVHLPSPPTGGPTWRKHDGRPQRRGQVLRGTARAAARAAATRAAAAAARAVAARAAAAPEISREQADILLRQIHAALGTPRAGDRTPLRGSAVQVMLCCD